MSAADKKMLLKSLGFVALLIICLVAIALTPLRDYFSPEHLARLKMQYNDRIVLFTTAFIIIGSGLIAIGFPRTIFCVAAGMLYNFWLGLLIGQLAAVLGAYVTYCLSSKMMRPFFQAKATKYCATINKLSRGNPVIMVALLRQAPIPGIVTNSLGGMLDIRARDFLLGSFIGFLPQTIVFCLFGSSVNHNFMLRITLAFILFVIMILGVKLYINRRFRLKSA